MWRILLFSNKKEWLKNLLTILLPLLISEFVIAIFPSFQVGLGIFIFLMLILFLVRDKSKLFQDKKQIIRLGIVFILTLFLVGYFVYTNIDELLISLNTVYPGKRVVTGGDGSIIDLFTDLTTIFLPYRETIPYSNFSEVSTYLHFGMFFVLLSPVLIKELKKKKDRNSSICILYDNRIPRILSKINVIFLH